MKVSSRKKTYLEDIKTLVKELVQNQAKSKMLLVNGSKPICYRIIFPLHTSSSSFQHTATILQNVVT